MKIREFIPFPKVFERKKTTGWFGLLWHMTIYRLFNAKPILVQIVLFQTIKFSISTEFVKNISISSYSVYSNSSNSAKYQYRFCLHTVSRIIKQVSWLFFVWALLLIVHTWNSSPLRSYLPRLQCTCYVVSTIFPESTTILNACTKKSMETYWKHHVNVKTVPYWTIQFSVSTVSKSKTILFQAIPFSISTQFKC